MKSLKVLMSWRSSSFSAFLWLAIYIEETRPRFKRPTPVAQTSPGLVSYVNTGNSDLQLGEPEPHPS
jgi:hypothetical protein